MWSDVDAELLMSISGGGSAASASSVLEVDSLTPSLLMSAAPHLSTDFLLDDLSLDGTPLTSALPEPSNHSLQPSPLPQHASHSHDGLHVCEYSASACPLNPYGGDPIFSQPMLTATPDTVTALRGAVTRQPSSEPATPPTPVSATASPLALRHPPPPYSGARHRIVYQQQQQSGETRRPLVQSPVRAPPRLKVARRLNQPAVLSSHLLPLASSARQVCELSSQAGVTAAGRLPLDCKHTKPNLSYVNLITLALLNSPAGSLRCNEIYEFLQRAFPYFREINSKTWKNDTRHALSSNQSSSNFCKAPESKNSTSGGNRGALWMAKPEKLEFLHEHLSKTYQKFADNIREAMGSADLYDELLLVVQQGSCSSQYFVLDVASPCAQSPTVGSTTDSPDGLLV